MYFDIKPMKGVGPIEFGMTPHQVKSIMRIYCGGKDNHSNWENVDYFFGNAIEVSYDNDGKVNFITSQYYTHCGCDFILYDIDPFDIEAQKLFKIIKNHVHGNHEFNPDEYLFEDKIINLWGSDYQHDYKGVETRSVYAQVGIGNENYLRTIK